MQLIKLEDLIIPDDRQRKDKPPAHIEQLKASILSKGLMHPLVVRNDGCTLVAGECRSLALRSIYEEKLEIVHNGVSIPHGLLPFVRLADLSPADVMEAELEENLVRANLHWMEAAQARSLIHSARELRTGATDLMGTARQLSELNGKDPLASRMELQRSLLVMEHKDVPGVKVAKTLREAHRIVLDKISTSFRSSLVALGHVSTDHTILLGDCRTLLPGLEKGSYDIILTDPPYGIDADEMKKSAKHFYDDSPANALDICKTILREGFHLLKPKGIVFMFGDIRNFDAIITYSKQQGYTPWPLPVIWKKGDEGHAPWGRDGFIRTYEVFFFFSKGQKGLKGGGPDIKDFPRATRGDRVHAAEKPVALLSHLLTLAGDQGDRVLDPCAGSGPILEAASRTGMTATAIELDPDYHELCLARLNKPESAQAPHDEELDELLT